MLDYDDNSLSVVAFVNERWKKISERRTKQRIRSEKVAKKKREREKKKAREEAQKRYEDQKKAQGSCGFPRKPPGSVNQVLLQALMSDPELMKAFSNPKIMEALQDIMANPANKGKYENDEEIMSVLQRFEKLTSRGGMGVGGGGGGGMGGGMGVGMASKATTTPQSTSGPTLDECRGMGGGMASKPTTSPRSTTGPTIDELDD